MIRLLLKANTKVSLPLTTKLSFNAIELLQYLSLNFKFLNKLFL